MTSTISGSTTDDDLLVDTEAVVLVGGKGTRLRPLTISAPKPMLPTAGLPFQFDQWADYEKYVDDMLTTGIIDNINEIRWDIRPAPHWGTVEVRVCDGLPTLEEILAITAFIQCLVDDMSERLDAGETLPTMPDWFHNENKWRAARYGMDAIIIENAEADERLVTECLADEIERLSPVAERLGCAEELHSITSIIERGVPYQRLQKVFGATGSLTEVTRSLKIGRAHV